MSKHTLNILGHLVKKTPLRILKDGLAPELLRQMCKGGLIFMCLAAYVSSNLKHEALFKNTKIKIAPSVDKGRILIRIFSNVSHSVKD